MLRQKGARQEQLILNMSTHMLLERKKAFSYCLIMHQSYITNCDVVQMCLV